MRPWVYIAGPISTGNQWANVTAAMRYWDVLWHRGFQPLCPHWSYFQDLAFPGLKHEDWMEYDYPLVSACDCLLRIPGASRGADLEVAYAERNGIPVYTDLESLYANMERLRERRAAVAPVALT